MKWIDLNERKPEEGQTVLIHIPIYSGPTYAVAQYSPELLSSLWDLVTHWMPLPEPPKNVRWRW